MIKVISTVEEKVSSITQFKIIISLTEARLLSTELGKVNELALLYRELNYILSAEIVRIPESTPITLSLSVDATIIMKTVIGNESTPHQLHKLHAMLQKYT